MARRSGLVLFLRGLMLACAPPMHAALVTHAPACGAALTPRSTAPLVAASKAAAAVDASFAVDTCLLTSTVRLKPRRHPPVYRAARTPRRSGALLASAAAPSDAPVNITWRKDDRFAEGVVPSVSLTRSRDRSTGTATFRFERANVLSMNNVWNFGLITGIYLQDEEGLASSSTDLKVNFDKGQPKELVAILVLKSPAEWERFMRFMRRYAAANELEFERSPREDG